MYPPYRPPAEPGLFQAYLPDLFADFTAGTPDTARDSADFIPVYLSRLSACRRARRARPAFRERAHE